MQTLPTRALTAQLADDLDWLEKHARAQKDQERAANQLRLAAALTRNVLGPYLDDQPSTPLHVAVVGGAGAGKSTVANMLCGAVSAEANPQAGFTRHPIAYTGSAGAVNWAAHVGFLGPLTRLTQPGPSSLDQDVYQVRRVQADPVSAELLKEWVVWDCPDMTTWAAEGYVPRLIEASGLADVVVYVASDERYNDEIPTQFLKMLLHTNKPVVVCLMKMREADAAAMAAHFRKEVLDGMPDGLGRGVVSVLPVPFLSRQQLADPINEAKKYRIPLLNQVAVLGGAASRRRNVVGASNYLTRHQAELVSVAKNDLDTMQRWQQVCVSGQGEFEGRYRNEYLTTEKFRGFDESLVRLMELLELPGIGQVVSKALYVVRTPYRLLRDWLAKTLARPDAPTRPEQPILEDALKGWLDLLHREAARRGGEHPLWDHVNRGFQSSAFPSAARERFAALYREFQSHLTLETDRTARSIYEELKKKPILLNSLRSGKLALDVAAIAGTIASVPTAGLWWNVVLVPLVASLTHQLVELLGKSVVESQREQARQRQGLLLSQHLAGPMGEWLAKWPATGGSSFERLQTALTRMPASVAEIQARVRRTTAQA